MSHEVLPPEKEHHGGGLLQPSGVTALLPSGFADIVCLLIALLG